MATAGAVLTLVALPAGQAHAWSGALTAVCLPDQAHVRLGITVSRPGTYTLALEGSEQSRTLKLAADTKTFEVLPRTGPDDTWVLTTAADRKLRATVRLGSQVSPCSAPTPTPTPSASPSPSPSASAPRPSTSKPSTPTAPPELAATGVSATPFVGSGLGIILVALGTGLVLRHNRRAQ